MPKISNHYSTGVLKEVRSSEVEYSAPSQAHFTSYMELNTKSKFKTVDREKIKLAPESSLKLMPLERLPMPNTLMRSSVSPARESKSQSHHHFVTRLPRVN